jgi:hypothetical protein
MDRERVKEEQGESGMKIQSNREKKDRETERKRGRTRLRERRQMYFETKLYRVVGGRQKVEKTCTKKV